MSTGRAANGTETTGRDNPRADQHLDDAEAERIAERLKQTEEPGRRSRNDGDERGDEAERNREKLQRELKDEIELPVIGSA